MIRTQVDIVHPKEQTLKNPHHPVKLKVRGVPGAAGAPGAPGAPGALGHKLRFKIK